MCSKMTQILLQVSLYDLEYIFFKYCTALEILRVRQTCKYLYQKIPESWTVGDLYVTESLDDQTSNLFTRLGISVRCHSAQLYDYIRNCRFVENLYVNHTELTQIRIGSKLNILTDMIITGSLSLEKLVIQNVVPNLKHLLINKIPKLKYLELCDAYQLQTINLFNISLTEFMIRRSWIRLRQIILINVGRIQQLYFPETCVNLREITLSQTQISKIQIDSLLNYPLNIQISNTDIQTIQIETPSRNQNMIQVDFFGRHPQLEWITT